MEAVRDAGSDIAGGVSVHALRALVGQDVVLDVPDGQLGGHLLSCTARSAWIVDGDTDHVVALPEVRAVHAGTR